MNVDGDREDQLASQLVAWDEALAKGDTPAPTDTPNAAPEVQARLARVLECVKLIHEVRPRRPREDDSFTINRHREDESSAPRPELPDTVPVPPSEGGQASPAEKTLGRFQLRRELGRGGFGVVFLACERAGA